MTIGSFFSKTEGNGGKKAIASTCAGLASLNTKGSLGAGIADIVLSHSPRDIALMKVNFKEKVNSVNQEYKRELESTIAEFLDGTYQTIRLMSQQGSFMAMKDPVSENAPEYWNMVAEQCGSHDDPGNRLRFLKFLLSGFCMLVLEVPGHPVGMPFPGGDKVDYIDGFYYCPVRTKANDVDAALCPFCPAQQTPEIGYLKQPVKGLYLLHI